MPTAPKDHGCIPGIASWLGNSRPNEKILHISVHHKCTHTQGWVSKGKAKVWGVHVMRLPHCIYQLSPGSTDQSTIATICLYVCMHTHSPSTDDTTFVGEQITCLLIAKKSTMRAKAYLFFNPISENGFYDTGIIHSTS